MVKESFKEIKRVVSTETLLNYSGCKIPFTVHTYYSDKVLGSRISHNRRLRTENGGKPHEGRQSQNSVRKSLWYPSKGGKRRRAVEYGGWGGASRWMVAPRPGKLGGRSRCKDRVKRCQRVKGGGGYRS